MSDVPENILLAAAGMLQPFSPDVTAENLNDFIQDQCDGLPRMVSVTDAARRLGVSRVTVYQMIKDGRLKARALNPQSQRKHYKIPLTALIALCG